MNFKLKKDNNVILKVAEILSKIKFINLMLSSMKEDMNIIMIISMKELWSNVNAST